MILMSDFLGAYQVKEGQNCPPGGICHYLGWAGLFGIALTGYGVGLGWAVYKLCIRAYSRKHPELLRPAWRRAELDA